MKEKLQDDPADEKLDYIASGQGAAFILEVLGKRAQQEGWSNDKLAEKISAFSHLASRHNERKGNDS